LNLFYFVFGSRVDEGVENSKVKSSKTCGLSVPLEASERPENIVAPNFGTVLINKSPNSNFQQNKIPGNSLSHNLELKSHTFFPISLNFP
jgi:hypothetical protein